MPRGRQATKITLSEAERAELERIVRASTSEQRMVVRARVALLAAEGRRTKDIAA